MITNNPVSRGVGRPRTFDDDAIFVATSRTLNRLGYARLTLAAVADELGSSPPALIKRFRTKRRLMLEYGEWSVREADERFKLVRNTHASPLDALQARLLLPAEMRPDEASDPEAFARQLAFYLETAHDPEFRNLWDRRFQNGEEQIVLSLQQARAAGELSADCDVQRLARTLHAALTGEALLATIDSRQSMMSGLMEVFTDVVGPHRTAPAAERLIREARPASLPDGDPLLRR